MKLKQILLIIAVAIISAVITHQFEPKPKKVLSRAAIPNPNLYYKFAETSGTSANDEVTTLDGTYGSTALINQPGKIGRCVSLDGTNNARVTIPNNSVVQFGTSSFTIRMWVYITGLPNAKNGLTGGETGCAWLYVTSGGNLGFGKRNVNDATTSSLTVSTNAWHYIAVTDNQTTDVVTYRVDGNTQTVSYNTEFTAGANMNLIGMGYANVDKTPALFDEFGVWNQVLTSQNLTDDYNAGAGKTYPWVTETPPVAVVHKSIVNRIIYWMKGNNGNVAPQYVAPEPVPEDNFTGDVLYVDYTGGSDANNGLTETTPIKTLSRAQALLNNTFEYLALSDETHYGAQTLTSIVRTLGNSLTITTWHKYGSGNAKISGLATIGPFTDMPGNYWGVVDAQLPTGPIDPYVTEINRSDYQYYVTFMPKIYIDDVPYKISKYPAGKTYLTSSSVTNSGSPNYTVSAITDNNNPRANGYWDGGWLCTEAPTWDMAKCRISSYSSNRFNLSYVNDEEFTQGYDGGSTGLKYHIINHRNATLSNGQWYSKPDVDSLVIYYNSNLNSHVVKAPVRDQLLTLTSCQYVTIDGVDFIGANAMDIKLTGCTGIVIKNCNFYDAPWAAVYAKTVAGLTITDCNVYGSGSNGFTVFGGANFIASRNYLKAIGTDETYMGDKNGTNGIGITAQGVSGIVDVSYNHIDSTAYAGITTSDLVPTVNYQVKFNRNWINNAMMTLSDGAAIYMHRNSNSYLKLIRGNLITNTYGNSGFNRNSESLLTMGIYLDTHNSATGDVNIGDNRMWVLDSNCVYKAPQGSFSSPYAYPNFWRDNLFVGNYNPPTQNYAIKFPDEYGGVRNSEYLRNKMVFTGATQYGVYWRWAGTYINYGNTFDYTDYYNPFSTTGNIWIDYNNTIPNTLTPHDLTWVRNNSPYEDHGTYNKSNWHFSDVSGISSDDFLKLFSNWSTSSHTFSLGTAVFKDLDGNNVSGSLTLPAFGFKCLMYVSGSLSGLVTTWPGGNSSQSSSTPQADYYVSPSGSDSNPGTYDQPFATWQKGWDMASAGKLVYVRGGTYRTTTTTGAILNFSNKNGTSTDTIKIYAYPGEKPVLNMSNLTMSGYAYGLYMTNADYVHLKGLRITGMAQSVNTNVNYGAMIYTGCQHVVLENMEFDHNSIGIHVYAAGASATTDITLLNCDAYYNQDPYSGYGGGDGFAFYSGLAGTTCYVKKCRSWGNSDDGTDCINSTGTVNYDSCVFFRNGYRPGTTTAGGDGIGYKLGRTGDDGVTSIIRTLTRCIAFDNRGNGFDQNFDDDQPTKHHPCALYNCVSYRNGLLLNGIGYRFGKYNDANILRNNVAYANIYDYAATAQSTVDHNTWNGAVTVNSSDFASLDTTGMSGARVNGQMPVLNLFRLATGSDLINAGVNVGLPYLGAAPDMGAIEKQ